MFAAQAAEQAPAQAEGAPKVKKKRDNNVSLRHFNQHGRDFVTYDASDFA